MDKKANDAYSTLYEACRMVLAELENARKTGVYDLNALKGAIESFNKESKCVFDACVCASENNSEYQMVDLGLPSGLKWADRNVGSSSPQDYGDYFMWGSTTPDTNNMCDWAHAPFNNEKETFDEDYFIANSGMWMDIYSEEDIRLKPKYDAAHIMMGDGWRMPTNAEVRELIDGTTHSAEKMNGISGVRFTSKTNGNSIFMPFAGYRDGSDADGVGNCGIARSSSLVENCTNISHCLDFYSYGKAYFHSYSRYYGFVVRGVHD